MNDQVRLNRPLPPRSRKQRGFTMTEVMIALAIFVISVAGVVSMESKSFEAQAAAKHLREGQRLAQRVMSEAMASGFSDLVSRSALGELGGLPHDDILGSFPFSEAPTDYDPENPPPGVSPNFYRIGRRVTQVMLPGSTPAGNDPALADAVLIEVYVLWLDGSNAAYPPPADVVVEDLTLSNTVAGSADFQPWVQSVLMRAVRLNDG